MKLTYCILDEAYNAAEVFAFVELRANKKANKVYFLKRERHQSKIKTLQTSVNTKDFSRLITTKYLAKIPQSPPHRLAKCE